jgi:hypothetical protein
MRVRDIIRPAGRFKNNFHYNIYESTTHAHIHPPCYRRIELAWRWFWIQCR